MNFNKILVPLDGSEHAEKIGEFVAGLARPLGSEIVLMAVVNSREGEFPEASAGPGHPTLVSAPSDRLANDRPSPGATGRGGQLETQPSAGSKVLGRGVEFAKHYLVIEAERLSASGVKSTTYVVVGQPAEEIVRYAAENHVDLIAMATHRESSLARGIMGSVTDRVLHSTSVPMLVIHPKSALAGNTGAPTAVVVPLDGSPLSEAAVPVALGIARACSSETVFIRAVRLPNYGVSGPGAEYYAGDYGIAEQRSEALEYLDRFVKQASEKGLKARAHAAIGDPATGIIQEAEGLKSPLIVMSTQGASGFKRWVVGSVTDKVVRSSGVPVLILLPQL